MSSNKNFKDEVDILFVDDEKGIREQAKLFLERENERFNITTASGVASALDLMKKTDFDTIVSDYKMPERDGLEFLEIVREEWEDNIPFIILTGKGKEEVAMNALNTGANGYLQKGGKSKTQYKKLTHLIEREIEYQETERALQKSEEKYRLIFEKNPIGLMECNTNCKIMDINERMLEILGAPDKETAIGTDITKGNDEEPEIKQELERAIEEKEVIDAERTFTSPWGKEIKMSFRILPLTDEKGDVFELTVVCHDVIFY